MEQRGSGVWVPSDHRGEWVGGTPAASSVVVDNRTDLPDEAVLAGVETFFEQTAGFSWGQQSTFQMYAAEGSMMARSKFRTPGNVIDEIRLARDIAERDDDVASVMGMMQAAAWSRGFMNLHADVEVQHAFDKMTEDVDLQGAFHEFYRELLISGQINSVSIFRRANYDIKPDGASRVMARNMQVPMMGVLPAEQIRVIGNSIVPEYQDLGYLPTGNLQLWLREFFADSTSEARRAEMRREDPLSAALFVEQVYVPWNDQDLLTSGLMLYRLNPEMVQRSTFAKGAWQYPRPPLTRNFALLEAKRLLNIMDFALLQGGTSYIVLAKKGTDERPALPQEVENLREVVRRAGRSGVMVGDHRLSLEIITPDLTELLNPAKRRMLGRKIATSMLRLPERAADDTGQSVATDTELISRVIEDDRALVVNHVKRNIWKRVMQRNTSTFGRVDAPKIWHPQVVLQGMQFWTDYVLKLLDRGNIPRAWANGIGGFDYDAAVAQRSRELANNHDNILVPPQVPYSSPQNGPQDNPAGRPPGSPDQPGTAPARRRPTRTVTRNPGETVRAWYDQDHGRTMRVGVLTERILLEYPAAQIGRMTAIEQDAVEQVAIVQDGPVTVVPVNRDYPTEDHRVMRLEDGLAMIVGKRVTDEAVVAKAFCFREPHWERHAAQDAVLRWGFEWRAQGDQGGVGMDPASFSETGDPATCPSCGEVVPVNLSCTNCGFDGPPFLGSGKPHGGRRDRAGVLAAAEGLTLVINSNGDGVKQVMRRRIVRGENGEIEAIEEEPVDMPEECDLTAEDVAKGRTVPGKYIYLRCPECGLVQDAAHTRCSRCGHDLTDARKAMFAALEKQKQKPTLHSVPPPPASKQKDIRKKPKGG